MILDFDVDSVAKSIVGTYPQVLSKVSTTPIHKLCMVL